MIRSKILVFDRSAESHELLFRLLLLSKNAKNKRFGFFCFLSWYSTLSIYASFDPSHWTFPFVLQFVQTSFDLQILSRIWPFNPLCVLLLIFFRRSIFLSCNHNKQFWIGHYQTWIANECQWISAFLFHFTHLKLNFTSSLSQNEQRKIKQTRKWIKKDEETKSNSKNVFNVIFVSWKKRYAINIQWLDILFGQFRIEISKPFGRSLIFARDFIIIIIIICVVFFFLFALHDNKILT